MIIDDPDLIRRLIFPDAKIVILEVNDDVKEELREHTLEMMKSMSQKVFYYPDESGNMISMMKVQPVVRGGDYYTYMQVTLDKRVMTC